MTIVPLCQSPLLAEFDFFCIYDSSLDMRFQFA